MEIISKSWTGISGSELVVGYMEWDMGYSTRSSGYWSGIVGVWIGFLGIGIGIRGLGVLDWDSIAYGIDVFSGFA